MNKILNALSVVALGAIGAGVVVYTDSKFTDKTINDQDINRAIETYIGNNSQKILEVIAKDDTFGTTIKNFTMISDEDINQRMRDYFEHNPILLKNYIESHADEVAKMVLNSAEFKGAIKTDVAEVVATEEVPQEAVEANPNQIYLDHWNELKNNEVSPSVGPKDAKVTLIEFFDFACGHCKALAPVMSQLMKDNPDVRFIFNPLFFISEHSPYAAKVALAAAQKGKFKEVFDGIMTLPNINEEEINKILVDEGLKVSEIKKMIDEKSIRRGIQDIDALSQVLGINGVPMLLINGEAFYGRSIQDIQAKINSLK